MPPSASKTTPSSTWTSRGSSRRGRREITMRAADGGRYPSRGHFLSVTPPQRLRFELSHLAADQAPVFTAIHDLRLTDHGQRTRLNLAIRVTAASPAAPAAVAGIQPGWQQLLSNWPAPSPAAPPSTGLPQPSTGTDASCRAVWEIPRHRHAVLPEPRWLVGAPDQPLCTAACAVLQILNPRT